MEPGNNDKQVKVEIEKTLVSINSIILEIRRELKAVTDLFKSNGELHSSVLSAMKKLSEEAKSLGIDINAITNTQEDLFRISTEPINAVEQLLSSSVNQ